MGNFKDPKLVDSTESLLPSVENLDNDLKIMIILPNKMHINSTETEKNCLDWNEKYLRAYNYWLSLGPFQKADNSWKEMLVSFVNW